MKKKISYVALSADILHEGHLNIIKTAHKYGRVIVGLLTDKAILEYKNLPFLNFEQRMKKIKGIKFVSEVVPQNSFDHTDNLIQFKPDYVVHGDDWKSGPLRKVRSNAIKVLKKWNGKLIEPKYTKKYSADIFKKELHETGAAPGIRRERFNRLLHSKKIVRILESHSPLTGLIIENLKIKKNNSFLEFDGMWSSSLTDSTLRGKPDNQSVDYSIRISGLGEILDVTTKPIIFDGDNGGRLEHLPYLIKTLDRLGVSAIVLEDKIGLKKNSLFDNQKNAAQDKISNFCKKIEKASNVKISEDFQVVARIESLIFNKGMKDAIKRAEAYSEAGSNLILIHSKKKKPSEIFEFADKFKKSKYYKPIIVVPSTYSSTREEELIKSGIKVVIYANHMLRASYPAMVEVAKKILLNKRSKETEKKIISIKEILHLIK